MTIEMKRRRRPQERPRPVRIGADGVTYYDRPAVKHAPWLPHVGVYIFVGGISGGAQVVAGVARLKWGERADALVANAHVFGLIGSAVGAGLLVYDLKTPHRFLNMLRIFRPTSPMSVGSFVLVTFGAACAVGTLATVRPRGSAGRAMTLAGRIAEVPAVASGALLATYTASLLAATSTPLWAAAAQPLGGHFGASALSSGAAALSLMRRAAGDARTADRLDEFAVLASAVDGAFVKAADERVRDHGVQGSVDGPHEPVRLDRLAFGLACLLPVASHVAARALGRRSPALSVIASLGIIAGTMISKTSIIPAGKASADRPRDYFRMTADGAMARIGETRAPLESRRHG